MKSLPTLLTGATAESDRAFTLRIRDRERRLIRKIQSALQRIDDGTYGICDEREETAIPRLKAVRHPSVHQLQGPSRKRTNICAATSAHP